MLILAGYRAAQSPQWQFQRLEPSAELDSGSKPYRQDV